MLSQKDKIIDIGLMSPNKMHCTWLAMEGLLYVCHDQALFLVKVGLHSDMTLNDHGTSVKSKLQT
jgi:hypothetical protein